MLPTTLRLLIVALTIAITLIPARGAFAKGSPVKVVITGPGLAREVVVTSPTLLEAFTGGRFDANNRIISRSLDFRPDVALGQGYRIDRYLVESSLWDTLTYYPDPDGREGYIYYDGNKYPLLYNQNRSLWFRANAAGDAAMQAVIVPTVRPVDMPAGTVQAHSMLIGSLVGTTLITASLIFARKRHLRRRA